MCFRKCVSKGVTLRWSVQRFSHMTLTSIPRREYWTPHDHRVSRSVCPALSLLLIYIPPSFHSGCHGSKEPDSNSAAVGWSLSQVVGDDRRCLREPRCGRTHCDVHAAAMAAAAAATHALSCTPAESSWRERRRYTERLIPNEREKRPQKHGGLKGQRREPVCEEKPQTLMSLVPHSIPCRWPAASPRHCWNSH